MGTDVSAFGAFFCSATFDPTFVTLGRFRGTIFVLRGIRTQVLATVTSLNRPLDFLSSLLNPPSGETILLVLISA